MEYIREPKAIEKGSMAIIESEMADISVFSEEELKIIKRVIHTTADFDYEGLIRFGGDVISTMKRAIGNKCKIYSDTRMIQVGVNQRLLKDFGCEVVNYVHDEDVYEMAKAQGMTRSMVAMEKAYRDPLIGIYLIGNAPTALIRLMELIEEDRVKGKALKALAIIGVPVGFVGAAESKKALVETNHRYITIEGRKGGSPVAVSIMNAVLLMHKQDIEGRNKDGV